MPTLVIQTEGATERIAMEANAVTLGRGLESDIRLKDIKASRKHCKVIKTAQGFKVLDLGSGNGTFVNGVQVKEQPLKAGDAIQIGDTVITFEAASGEAAPAPAPKPAAPAPAPAPGPAAPAPAPAPGPAAPAPAAKPPTSRVAMPGTSIPSRPAPKPVSAETARIASKPTVVSRPAGKPVTDRAPLTPKPDTQKVPPPAAKPPTEKIPEVKSGAVKATTTKKTRPITTKRGPTGRMRKTTRRGHTGRSTGPISKTERFTVQASKKSRPILWLCIVFVLIGGAVAFLLTLPSEEDRWKSFKKKFERSYGEASKMLDDGELKDAKKMCKRAFDLCEDFGPDANTQKGEAKRLMEAIKEREKFLEEAKEKWGEFKASYEEEYKKFNVNPLIMFEGNDLRKGAQYFYEWFQNRFQKQYAGVPWTEEYKDYRGRIDAWLKREEDTKLLVSFPREKERIDKEFLQQDAEKYGPAIKDWRQYLTRQGVEDGDKTRAREEIERLNGLANTAIRRLEPKVKAKSITFEEMKALRVNFEGIDKDIFEKFDYLLDKLTD
ncbi:MAG: FHA domain-containing protein [Planctomycetota bacterium]|jgi:pSer/pThr/pTyr-binding forkhead associated (FHA) protein